VLQTFSPLEQTRAEAKTLDINASVQGSYGESAAASPASAHASNARRRPVLKSGLDNARGSLRGGKRAAENPLDGRPAGRRLER
jgi:hypothetical protein